MFNPVIIAALVAQTVISKINRAMGAIASIAITVGIFIWGTSLYAEGNAIALFGIPLSQQVFNFVCLFWLMYDFKDCQFIVNYYKRKSLIKEALVSPLMEKEHVKLFYKNTQTAWLSGAMDNISGDYKNIANEGYKQLVKEFAPYYNNAIYIFFTQFSPLENEYLIANGDSDDLKESGWFIVTNKRIIQKQGTSKDFVEIYLSDIRNYKGEDAKTNSLNIELNTGNEVVVKDIKLYPNKEFINKILQHKLVA